MALDELCVLSAIRPYNGGPSTLFWISDDNSDEIASVILRNLLSSPYLSSEQFPKDVLENIVSDVLKLHALIEDLGEEYPWKSYPTKGWEGFEQFYTIGYFDDEEEQSDDPNWRPRCGNEICMRLVDMDSRTPWCAFTQYWDEEEDEWVDGFSNISAWVGNPNIGCYDGPLSYLKAWIDWDALPSRAVAFPDNEEPLSVEAELYEIINSRREVPGPGTVAFIDFGGIEKAHEQFQETFDGAWPNTTVHFEKAIRDGLRGEDLMVPLSRDFGAWMCVRTDVWPEAPSKPQLETLPLPVLAQRPTIFHTLPPELLFSILVQIPPPDCVALLAVSRALRNLLQNGVLDKTVRHQILSANGALRWILPVDTMTGEEEAFESACATWLRRPAPASDAELPMTAIQQQDFPHFAFISSAWAHDSMRNRRRFWNITKQYEALWWDYRTNGWQNDVFKRAAPEGGEP